MGLKTEELAENIERAVRPSVFLPNTTKQPGSYPVPPRQRLPVNSQVQKNNEKNWTQGTTTTAKNRGNLFVDNSRRKEKSIKQQMPEASFLPLFSEQ